jgi:hypothetical protein
MPAHLQGCGGSTAGLYTAALVVMLDTLGKRVPANTHFCDGLAAVGLHAVFANGSLAKLGSS